MSFFSENHTTGLPLNLRPDADPEFISTRLPDAYRQEKYESNCGGNPCATCLGAIDGVAISPKKSPAKYQPYVLYCVYNVFMSREAGLNDGGDPGKQEQFLKLFRGYFRARTTFPDGRIAMPYLERHRDVHPDDAPIRFIDRQSDINFVDMKKRHETFSFSSGFYSMRDFFSYAVSLGRNISPAVNNILPAQFRFKISSALNYGALYEQLMHMRLNELFLRTRRTPSVSSLVAAFQVPNVANSPQLLKLLYPEGVTDSQRSLLSGPAFVSVLEDNTAGGQTLGAFLASHGQERDTVAAHEAVLSVLFQLVHLLCLFNETGLQHQALGVDDSVTVVQLPEPVVMQYGRLTVRVNHIVKVDNFQFAHDVSGSSDSVKNQMLEGEYTELCERRGICGAINPHLDLYSVWAHMEDLFEEHIADLDEKMPSGADNMRALQELTLGLNQGFVDHVETWRDDPEITAPLDPQPVSHKDFRICYGQPGTLQDHTLSYKTTPPFGTHYERQRAVACSDVEDPSNYNSDHENLFPHMTPRDVLEKIVNHHHFPRGVVGGVTDAVYDTSSDIKCLNH